MGLPILCRRAVGRARLYPVRGTSRGALYGLSLAFAFGGKRALLCRCKHFFEVAGLVAAGLAFEGDVETVPTIDRGDGQCEVGELFVVEVTMNFFEDVVGNFVILQQCDGFCPCEGRAFLLTVKRRVAPGIQTVKALFGFAHGAEIFRMHVETVGATVDLGDAKVEEVEQLSVEAAAEEIFFDSEERFQSAGVYRGEVDSFFHSEKKSRLKMRGVQIGFVSFVISLILR